MRVFSTRWETITLFLIGLMHYFSDYLIFVVSLTNPFAFWKKKTISKFEKIKFSMLLWPEKAFGDTFTSMAYRCCKLTNFKDRTTKPVYFKRRGFKCSLTTRTFWDRYFTSCVWKKYISIESIRAIEMLSIITIECIKLESTLTCR